MLFAAGVEDMMGSSHAMSGAAAWLALTATTVPAVGLFPASPGFVVLGAVIASGAALLPDADHHNATIAHSIPVAGRLAAGAIGAATGGHRNGMHSILAIVAVTIGMIVLGQWAWTPDGWDRAIHLGSGVAATACVTFAVKSLKLVRSWPIAWLTGGAVGAAVAFLAPEQSAWLPWCIGVGYLVHLLGDLLTAGGVPLLWPIRVTPPKAWQETPILNTLWLPGGRVAIPILGTTGSWREQILFLCLGAYVLWGVAAESISGIQQVTSAVF